MANRLSDDLRNLNGIKIADLKETLQKLEEKQNNHSRKDNPSIEGTFDNNIFFILNIFLIL